MERVPDNAEDAERIAASFADMGYSYKTLVRAQNIFVGAAFMKLVRKLASNVIIRHFRNTF